jgi:hypothetical protein
MACALALVIAAAARGAPRAAGARASRDRRPHDDRERFHPSSGQATGVAIAWGGMAAAIAALLGHLIEPSFDPLWFGLLAVAFATVPGAMLVARPKRRARPRATQDRRSAR